MGNFEQMILTCENAVALYKNKLPDKNQIIELRDRCEGAIIEHLHCYGRSKRLVK